MILRRRLDEIAYLCSHTTFVATLSITALTLSSNLALIELGLALSGIILFLVSHDNSFVELASMFCY